MYRRAHFRLMAVVAFLLVLHHAGFSQQGTENRAEATKKHDEYPQRVSRLSAPYPTLASLMTGGDSRNGVAGPIESGLLSAGDIVMTSEYSSGNGGGNHYEITQAADDASRPTHDGGSIIHLTVSDCSGWYLRGLFPNESVSVTQFGAKGDNATDNTPMFEACRDYCIANRKTMFAPDGLFRFDGDVDLWGVHKIRFNGSLQFEDTANKVILGGTTSGAPSMDIELFSCSGTVQVYGMNRGRLKINTANTLHLLASDAVANRHTVSYSVFEWVNLDNLHLECQDTAGGVPWINENTFYCGRVRNSILFDGTYPMNNNKFWSLALESATVDIQKGNSNQFHDVRLEGDVAFTFGPGTFNNSFVGFLGRQSTGWTITDDGMNNDIVSVQHLYADNTTLLELSSGGMNYDWSHFERVGRKLRIRKTYTGFFDTGLVPLDHPVWFIIESDAAAFNYFVEVFDDSGNRIYSDLEVVEGGMAWNDVSSCYDYSGAVVSGAEISIKQNHSVGFFRLYGRTAGGTLGQFVDHWRLRCIQKKKGARDIQLLPYKGGKNSLYGTGVPTLGTFAQGDAIENSAPAVGSPSEWRCVQSGTFSSATDATGDTDGDTAVISGMTETADFHVGDYVAVSAGFSAGDIQIVSIDSATRITVNRASNSPQTNVTVSTVDPLFGAMPDLTLPTD